jgi:spore coat polysaccharide biosynthesis protein SpsF
LVELANSCGVGAIAGSMNNVLSRMLLASEEYAADTVIRVTGDNVFTDPINIDRMVHRHLETVADYTRTSGLPWGTTAEVMSSAMLNRLEKLIPDLNLSGYLTLWAFDPDKFHCEILDAPENIRRPNYSLTVDTPEDLELARKLFEELAHSPAGPAILDIVKYLDADPGYEGISDDTPIKLPKGKIITFAKFMEMLTRRGRQAQKKYSLVKERN